MTNRATSIPSLSQNSALGQSHTKLNTSNTPSESPARSAIIAIGMRWTDRLIGILSTLILARLLVPADFGIIAMSSIVVGLVDTILALGVGTALIQNKNAEREDFDTAWTLGIFQGLLVFGILFIASPYAAASFHDDRITVVIRILGAAVLIGSLENIGIVYFQKNLQFSSDFKFILARRLISFTTTIIAAATLHSYWAMVIGTVVGRLAGVVLSFAMHSYRPRLTLSRARRLWSFTQWNLVRNIGNYGVTQLDKFLIGNRTDAATVGAYTLADEISAMPTTELLAPLGRVLLPVFARVSDDPDLLRKAFCRALGIQTLLALPAGVGLTQIAEPAVYLLLGDKWQQAIPLVQILSLIGIFTAMGHSSGYVLLAVGKIWIQAAMTVIQLILLFSLTVVAFPNTGATGVALARLSASALGMIILAALVIRTVQAVRASDMIKHTWRPLAGVASMWLAMHTAADYVHFGHLVQALALLLIGTIAYLFTVLLTWKMSGARDSIEQYLLDLIKPRVISIFSRQNAAN